MSYYPPRGNYIKDSNPFNLAPPPPWWLEALFQFDPDLAVVPSRQSQVYRLALKRKLRLTEHITNDALFNESDTRMLARYSLVPVTSIIANPNWSLAMLEELRRRAPHRQGGAEKVLANIEAQEAQEELDRRAKQDEILTDQAKDAWGFYLMKLGVRSHMYIPRTKDITPAELKSTSKAPAIIIPKSR